MTAKRAPKWWRPPPPKDLTSPLVTPPSVTSLLQSADFDDSSPLTGAVDGFCPSDCDKVFYIVGKGERQKTHRATNFALLVLDSLSYRGSHFSQINNQHMSAVALRVSETNTLQRFFLYSEPFFIKSQGVRSKWSQTILLRDTVFLS